VQYDLEREAERQDPAQAPAPEQPAGAREQLASAVGSSAMARAAQSGQAPRGLVSGAPMSVARKAASDELEEGAVPPAEAGAHEAEAEPAAPPAEAGAHEAAAPEAAPAAEHAPEGELEEEH
jgi:hypothetical protein